MIMKKLLLLLVLIFAAVIPMSAKDRYTHDTSVLPQAARTTIRNNFKSDVTVIKIDKDFGRISEYEVILSDGTEISFDFKGNWKNVETRKSSAVPNAFVLKQIRDYVAKAQPGTRVVGIEKERSGYDVELSNGIDMKFDSKGNFKRYDD